MIPFAFTVESRDPRETESIGERWGSSARPGDVLLLQGELGAGKTTLVRGLARGLGVSHGVKSPSFAIHLRYPGRLVLHHLDLYRVQRPRDVEELGLEDVLGRDAVAVVEWGERLGDQTPAGAVRVTFEEPEPDVRVLRVSGDRDPVTRLAAALGLAAAPDAPAESG